MHVHIICAVSNSGTYPSWAGYSRDSDTLFGRMLGGEVAVMRT